MKAVVCQNSELNVRDLPDPVPGEGQVLVRVLRCGICGSDLHMRHHFDHMHELAAKVGFAEFFGTARTPVVFGHEFCCEVLEHGPGCDRKLKPGTRVVAQPMLKSAGRVHLLGYDPQFGGGYAERMLLQETALVPVPNGLGADMAALTEPMAVGLHAVNRSQITPAHSAVVLGAGPVGLAVIAALRAVGVELIVTADFSATRRALATTMGAHQVVDPRDEPAIDVWRRLGAKGPLVIFEAVGVPGMLDAAMSDAPAGAQILVVGVCMAPDTVRPMVAIGKELNLQFVLGYDPLEFAESLRRIAEGEVDVAPMITGSVDIDAIPQAFADLADPEAHAKILVEPTT